MEDELYVMTSDDTSTITTCFDTVSLKPSSSVTVRFTVYTPLDA